MDTFDNLLKRMETERAKSASAYAPNQFGQFGKNLDTEALGKYLINQGLDPSVVTMMGARPEYGSVVGADGGLASGYEVDAGPNLLPELDQRSGNINLNTEALTKLRGRATSDSLSPWAQMMLDKQGVEQAGAMDKAAATSNAAAATARGSMARSGGVSAGARERIAKTAGRDLMTGRANVARQGQVDRFGIMADDDKVKLDLLKSLPGMEVQSLQPELEKLGMWSRMADNNASRVFDANKTNVNTRMQDKELKLKNDLGSYTEIMQAYGADRTAKAQEQGKK